MGEDVLEQLDSVEHFVCSLSVGAAEAGDMSYSDGSRERDHGVKELLVCLSVEGFRLYQCNGGVVLGLGELALAGSGGRVLAALHVSLAGVDMYTSRPTSIRGRSMNSGERGGRIERSCRKAEDQFCNRNGSTRKMVSCLQRQSLDSCTREPISP